MNEIIYIFLIAQVVRAPAKVQLSVFSRILPFEQNLGKRTENDTLTIWLIYSKDVKESVKMKEDFLNAFHSLKNKAIGGYPLKCSEIEINDKATLNNMKKGIAYITAIGIDNLNKILKIAEQNKIFTITGEPGYVEKGVAMSVVLVYKRPQVCLNLMACQTAGAKFNPQIMQFIKTIK